jgi:hypothetical protein
VEPTKAQQAWFNLASGTLCMIATGENGERVRDSSFGVDQAYVLDEYTPRGVAMDGGDW